MISKAAYMIKGGERSLLHILPEEGSHASVPPALRSVRGSVRRPLVNGRDPAALQGTGSSLFSSRQGQAKIFSKFIL